MAVPYTFGSATSSIPLSQLDSNFATAITLGTTNVYLGNTTTTLNGLTLSNVTISSGNVTITSVTITNANITGTTTLSGLTASTALALDASKNIVSVTNTGTGNNVLAASPSLTGTVTIATLNLTNALGTGYGGTGLTSYTANGVLYASSSSALTSGSALTFDGSAFWVAASSTSTDSLNTAGFRFGAGTFKQQYSAGFDFQQFYTSAGQSAPDASVKVGSGYYALALAGTEYTRLTSTGLGIGTSSPTVKLQVGVGYQASVVNALLLSNTHDGNAISGTSIKFKNYYEQALISAQNNPQIGYSYNQLNFQVYSGAGTLSDPLTMDFRGNLGLGVTPSAWYSTFKAFQFGGNGSSVFGRSENNTSGITSNGYVDSAGNWKYINSNYASYYQQLNSQHQWYTAASGTAGNAITFTQAMTLDASGNLGIGTTSPTYPLTVQANSSTQGIRLIGRASDNIANMSFVANNGSTEYAFINTGATYLAFGVNSAERCRIDSSGNLLLGTTSVIQSGTISLQKTGVSSNGISIKDTNSAGGVQVNFVNSSGTQCGYISHNGTLTVYNTTSDYRLKTVIGAVTGHGARIDALEPIEYKWNSNGSRTRGFLAHKFQEVYADSVTGTKDAVDDDGNPKYQAMQAGSAEVIADLVAEIQSLRKRLADAGI